jgi:predicted small lipoprotein YifL
MRDQGSLSSSFLLAHVETAPLLTERSVSSKLRRSLADCGASLASMMRRGLLAPLTLLALAACGGCGGLNASQDRQYQALEEQAEFTAEYADESAFCDLVQRAIDAGGMTYPLAYPVDVLEHYTDEHC